MIFIYGFLAAGSYFFYSMLVKKPEELSARDQAKRDAKKAKRDAKKSQWHE